MRMKVSPFWKWNGKALDTVEPQTFEFSPLDERAYGRAIQSVLTSIKGTHVELHFSEVRLKIEFLSPRD